MIDPLTMLACSYRSLVHKCKAVLQMREVQTSLGVVVDDEAVMHSVQMRRRASLGVLCMPCGSLHSPLHILRCRLLVMGFESRQRLAA